MKKKKRYDDKFRATAVVMLEGAGYPNTKGALQRVADHLRVPPRTLSRWFNGEQNPPPDRIVNEKRLDLREAIRAELEAIFNDSDLGDVRSEASYKDRMTAAAILIDKQQLLDGKPTERIETIERMLDALPEDEYSDIVAEAERVIAATRGGDYSG